MKKIFLVTGIVLFLVACGGREGDKKARLEQLKKQQDKITAEIATLEKEINPNSTVSLTKVNVEILTKKPFEHYIEVQGRIDGNDNIGVSPRNQGGVVTRILVHEGDNVTAGQVLAELDADVLKQQLKDLKNKLAFATDIYNRQKTLWDQGKKRYGVGSERHRHAGRPDKNVGDHRPHQRNRRRYPHQGRPDGFFCLPHTCLPDCKLLKSQSDGRGW